MARFLSPEWFDEIVRRQPPAVDEGPPGQRLVIEQVVRDGPDGEVRYRVVIAGSAARIEPAANAPAADLTITCDWATATAMAQGGLPAQAALMQGRLRIRGNLARLAGRGSDLVGLDPVPADVRARTTY
jgi:hypothetical protein